jgi:hypothetical protein
MTLRPNDPRPKDPRPNDTRLIILDPIFSNASMDFTVEICESPLLGLNRHHRAYELLVDVRFCKFEATSVDERRCRFRAADCEAITDELGLVDWHGLLSRKEVDLCVDISYDVIWSCFEKFVPRTSTRCAQKFPWVTQKLNGLKNKTTKANKKMKGSERRCMVDDDISECDCEMKESGAILLLLKVRIRSVMGLLMTIIVLALRRRLRPTLRVFLRC